MERVLSAPPEKDGARTPLRGQAAPRARHLPQTGWLGYAAPRHRTVPSSWRAAPKPHQARRAGPRRASGPDDAGAENLVPVDDPVRQLQFLAAEVIEFKRILGDKVEQLGAWTTGSDLERDEVRAILAAYERALDRTNTVLAGMLRLDIEDRITRLTEIQAQLMIGIFETVLASKEVGLSKDQVLSIKAIVAQEARRVTTLRAAELPVG